MINGASPGDSLAFPVGFTWGAATAAYQIEGAPDADGKGPSVWDTFSHTPGKVRGGDTGDVACDSYRRYPEDADLLRSLGLDAYRFSISWPRVFPDGGGKVNQAGLDHYRALADALAERGIAAAATLFHWDLPQALQDFGGWAARDTALRFADYAAVVGEALGDRVGRWITLNEPLVVSHNGYRIGVHAPGLCDDAAAAAATHHLLLGHGLATAALRAVIPARSEVGVTLNLTPVRVAQRPGVAEADGFGPLEQARLITDATVNGLFLEPLLSGRYPEHAAPVVLPPASLIHDGDMETIAAPLDFLGVNYYQPIHLRPGDPDHLLRDEEPTLPAVADVVKYRPDGMEQTPMGWLIDPEGLYELLLRLSKDAPGLPLFVTENGCAAEDYVNPDGAVYDVERVKYLHLHLAAAARAIRDGANLAGYFVWSLLDNFEWAYGYQKRFGIVYVDFSTQRRIPKASSAFYADVVQANAVPPLPAAWPSLRLAAAENLVEGAGDLRGQVGGPRFVMRLLRRPGPRLGFGVPDQAAVQAFDLVQPPDQVRAPAPGAACQVRERGRNTGGADEHLVLADHAPAPRAAFPRLGVHLPRAAPVTRHRKSSRPRTS
jgi:beta-glucosidase